MAILHLLLIPLRAPMLLVLMVISVYEGLQWSQPLEAAAASGMGQLFSLFWSLECFHALLVVVVCTMPDLLMQRISNLMSASRVLSLVFSLLIVTVGGLYLLHLQVLTSVLILGTTVLLSRLDLARIRVAPPPVLLSGVLGVLVLSGAWVGRWLASGGLATS
ncbi:MAG: hypothetical protein O2839_06285 [Cyanobacteria bacterium]|nr:hypothetical protein [Cyanobacteriota bacterium]MDA1246833.1 hypothetical protein [Cyanobacteriota bacterium]